MLRRVVWREPLALSAIGVGSSSSSRSVSHEHKDVTVPNAPKPPMIPHEPLMPMDFNPHIEWFEFPKDVFNPKFPFTREECVRATEESFDNSAEELAQRYGMRFNFTTRVCYWMSYMVMVFYCWQTMWGCYRAVGADPNWPQFRHAVEALSTCPTIDEDDIYLDAWIMPFYREKYAKHDRFYAWKPVTKRDGATKHQWAIPLDRRDPSEWIHMTSKV